jgi:hypothetical protein
MFGSKTKGCPFAVGDFVQDKSGSCSGEVVACYEEVIKPKNSIIPSTKWWVAYRGLDTVLKTYPSGASFFSHSIMIYLIVR